MTKCDLSLPYDGTLRDEPPTHCVADDCERQIMARGLCAMHYARWRKHGSLEPKPTSKEYKARYARFENLKKRHPDGFGWPTFKAYTASVGLPPTYRHRLYKADESRPIGPDNFEWRKSPDNPSKKPRVFDTHTKEGKAAYDRYLLANNPDRNRANAMRRNFGITIDDYNAMLVAQKACCAICKKPETVVKNGRPMQLSIDHDHGTGNIRGLLCTKCNRGLGMFCDSVENLTGAISYLKSASEQTVGGNVVTFAKMEA